MRKRRMAPGWSRLSAWYWRNIGVRVARAGEDSSIRKSLQSRVRWKNASPPSSPTRTASSCCSPTWDPLAVVSLVASRKEFVKWHAKQGLLLAFAVAALYLLLKSVHLLLLQGPWLVRVLGELFWTLVALTGLGLGSCSCSAWCAPWKGSASRCRGGGAGGPPLDLA
jgi:hypothetical protein